jgi:hypothetical protein
MFSLNSFPGSVHPAGRFSKFGGDLRSPSHGRRAVARLFRATVRRPCQNAPQGRFFFDADVARQKRDFRKEVFISIQFKAFDIFGGYCMNTMGCSIFVRYLLRIFVIY